MNNLKPNQHVFVAQFDRCVVKKNGDGNITFAFGLDAMEAVHAIEKLNLRDGVNFYVCVVPMEHGEVPFPR